MWVTRWLNKAGFTWHQWVFICLTAKFYLSCLKGTTVQILVRRLYRNLYPAMWFQAISMKVTGLILVPSLHFLRLTSALPMIYLNLIFLIKTLFIQGRV